MASRHPIAFASPSPPWSFFAFSLDEASGVVAMLLLDQPFQLVLHRLVLLHDLFCSFSDEVIPQIPHRQKSAVLMSPSPQSLPPILLLSDRFQLKKAVHPCWPHAVGSGSLDGLCQFYFVLGESNSFSFGSLQVYNNSNISNCSTAEERLNRARLVGEIRGLPQKTRIAELIQPWEWSRECIETRELHTRLVCEICPLGGLIREW